MRHLMRLLRAGRGVPILCAALLTFCAGSAAAGPLEALAAAQQGIDAKDPDQFRQAVDVDAILTHGIKDAIHALTREARNNPLNPLAALALQGMTDDTSYQAEVFKTLLISEINTFINVGIRSGAFAGEPAGETSSSLLSGLSPARKRIQPGRVLSKSGTKAAVSATFQDEEAGSFPLTLELEEREGRWRVVKILNIPELLQDVLRHGSQDRRS